MVVGGVLGGGGGPSTGFNPVPNENPAPLLKPLVVAVVVVLPNEKGLFVSGLGAVGGVPNEKLGFGASCLAPKENEKEGVCVPGVEVVDPVVGGVPRPMPPKGLAFVAGSGAVVVVGVGAVKENEGACVANVGVGIAMVGAEGAVTGAVAAGGGAKVNGALASGVGTGALETGSFAIPLFPNREVVVWEVADCVPLPKLNIGGAAELADRVSFGASVVSDVAFMLTANGDGDGAVERLGSAEVVVGTSTAGVAGLGVEAGGIPKENVPPLNKGFSLTGVARLKTGGAGFGASFFSELRLGGLSENGRVGVGFDEEELPNEKGSALTGPFTVLGAISVSGLGAGGVAVKANKPGEFDTVDGCNDSTSGLEGWGSATAGFGASARAAEAGAAGIGLMKKGVVGTVGNFGGPMESRGLSPIGLSPRNALIRATRFSSAFLVPSDADADS